MGKFIGLGAVATIDHEKCFQWCVVVCFLFCFLFVCVCFSVLILHQLFPLCRSKEREINLFNPAELCQLEALRRTVHEQINKAAENAFADDRRGVRDGLVEVGNTMDSETTHRGTGIPDPLSPDSMRGVDGVDRVHIQALYLEPEPFSVSKQLMTSTFHLRREELRHRFRVQISEMARALMTASHMPLPPSSGHSSKTPSAQRSMSDHDTPLRLRPAKDNTDFQT